MEHENPMSFPNAEAKNRGNGEARSVGYGQPLEMPEARVQAGDTPFSQAASLAYVQPESLHPCDNLFTLEEPDCNNRSPDRAPGPDSECGA